MKEVLLIATLFGLMSAAIVGLAADPKKYSVYAKECASRGGVAVLAIGGTSACVTSLR